MTTLLSFIEVSCDGGAQRILLSLLAGLDRTRYRPIVALIDEGWLADELRRRGEHVVVLPTGRGGWDTALLKGLAGLCRREQVDVIHAHLFDSGVYASLVGMVLRIPVVVSLHGQADWSPVPFRLTDFVKRTVINRGASRITYVSQALRSHFEALGLSRRRGHVVHNGIPIVEMRAVPERTSPAMRVGAVGHVKPWKGYEDLVAAAAIVVAEEPSVSFTVVGATDLAPDYTTTLDTLVAAHGLRERVHFAGPRTDVADFLASLDVYVLPSHTEGFSLSLVEAMAAARPVIATRCGGPDEIVTDGVTGILVPPRDPRTLASRLLELLRAPEQAKQLGSRAAVDVRRRFSQAAMVAAYHAVYASIAQPPRRESIYEAKKEGV